MRHLGTYSKALAARGRRPHNQAMQPSDEPAPESRRARTTLPPGEADAGAQEFELALVKQGETETRLQYLARVYGLPALR